HEFKLNAFTIDYDVAFASQTLAMALDGPWNLPRYKDLLKNLDWGITWLPAGNAKQATIAGGEYLTIFKQSQHPNEAWAFLRWILRPEVQAFWAMQSGYLPVRHAALQVPEFQAYLERNLPFKAYVEQMEISQSPTPIDYHGLRITRLMAEAIEKSTIGNVSPKAALDQAAQKCNELLASVAESK
ncbi:MAG TPA: extracellular solute-binding protein, partial [bacterium]